jgi:hypothetical protein
MIVLGVVEKVGCLGSLKKEEGKKERIWWSVAGFKYIELLVNR